MNQLGWCLLFLFCVFVLLPVIAFIAGRSWKLGTLKAEQRFRSYQWREQNDENETE